MYHNDEPPDVLILGGTTQDCIAVFKRTLESLQDSPFLAEQKELGVLGKGDRPHRVLVGGAYTLRYFGTLPPSFNTFKRIFVLGDCFPFFPACSKSRFLGTANAEIRYIF